MKNNKTSEGKFLVFFHNLDFDYWLVVYMNFHTDIFKSIMQTDTFPIVEYKPIGKYFVIMNEFNTFVQKKPKKFVYGPRPKNLKLGMLEIRNYSYSKTSSRIYYKNKK